ncbi:MAG: transporter substrate-binding domain-containing protein [Gammaproteobacteria bacterium]|nr:transporter substrate-binding domain-containing protein [Gammaproteobacteria bacterium]
MLSNQQQYCLNCSRSLISTFIKFALFISFIFISCLFSTYSFANSTPNNKATIALTTKEKAWLAAHPAIRIGVDADYAPYSFRDDDGNYRGIALEFSDYLSEQLGISMEVVPNLSWPEIVDGVRERKLDVVATFAHRPEREAFANFTKIYLPTPLVIMRRSDDMSISSETDLIGRTVAMVEGYSSSERILEEHPGVKPLMVKTAHDGLFAVSTGKANAYVGVLGINLYLVNKLGITNLEVASLYGAGLNGQRFGIRKDWPELASILDKALAAMPVARKREIFERWLPIQVGQFTPTEKTESFIEQQLTAEERDWLAEHSVLRLGNSVDWPPFGFISKEGIYSGIAAEYFSVIEKMLGITIEPSKLGSWKETVDAARKGEVDLLDAVAATPQRREFLTFTKPYISYPIVLFAHKDVDYIANMSVLNGQRVTVIEGSALHDILKNNHPEFEIIPTKNARVGLLAIKKGKASAFIGNLPTASRVMSREGITDLKVAGETPYRYDLTIGINKNMPILASLLQKALDSIPEEKHNEIYQKWMSVTFEHQVDYTRFVQFFAISVFIFTFILFWTRQSQVKKLTHEVESRKKIEESLRKSEQYNRMLFEESIIGLALCQMNGELVDINPAFASILGKTVEEIKSLSYWDITPEKYAVEEQEQLNILEKTGRYGPYDKEYIHADGHLVPVRLLGQFLEKDGIKYIWSSVEDITDSKLAEEEKELLQRELQESQKMEALGKLTGGIAHEYNNMLAITIGFATLLESELVEQPKLAKYAHEIQKAGDRGAKLTSKLLTFSRQKTPEANSVNLNMLLQKQHHLLEKTLTVRIKLVLNLQENPWRVWLDEGDMEDVILNMCINAMHAIEGNGQLTIQTRNQKINQMDAQSLAITPGDYVLLSFTDTGCGIDNKIKEKIFEPFFTTKGELGTGLGLSMVYGFVQNSGGAIKVYSEQGEGTQFTLYFPRYHGISHDQQSEKENNSEETFIGNKNILVVDDEPALLNLTSEILSLHGFNVICAESAKSALNILEHESIDILISDVIMPEMDGYQLAAIVKEKYPDIKIQLASGFTDDRNIGIVDDGLRNNLLNKPFNSQALLQRIRELCDED